MVQDRKCSKMKDKWGKLHGPSGQWCPSKHHHTKVCKSTFSTSGTSHQPHGFQSCLHGTSNAYTKLLGYVVIQVQVDRVRGYNEDQIALVILDFSNYATRVSVILGMPTIG